MSHSKIIVISGVMGVVGRAIVGELNAHQDVEIRILSRQPAQSKEFFDPDILIGGYSQKEAIITGADVLIHLAARNNDSGGTWDQYEEDNCELTEELAKCAKNLHVSQFIFTTSTKALSPKEADFYGRSKALAEVKLRDLESDKFNVKLIRLCPVYGESSRGKIQYFQSLPFGTSRFVLGTLRSVIPIVAAEKVATEVVSIALTGKKIREICLSDDIPKLSIYGIFVLFLNISFVVTVFTLLLIPLVISAVCISLTSKGPILFVQSRVGKSMEVFGCRKFRTMLLGTPNAGSHEVGTDSITKVGAVLRKFKIDELPQALNVLAGEMNVIGPRPCLENQSLLIKQRTNYGIFETKPGITGLAQSAGVDMSEPHKLSVLDQRYSALRSIKTDLIIFWNTVSGGGFGDAAISKSIS